MGVPPPLDPVLLREHAYQDTRILRLVLFPGKSFGFAPLHIRGLGSFDYESVRDFADAFSARGIDVNNKDPNVDSLSENSNNEASLLDNAISLIILVVGIYTLYKIAHKLWVNSTISSTGTLKNKNIKQLQLGQTPLTSTFDFSSELENGVLRHSIASRTHIATVDYDDESDNDEVEQLRASVKNLSSNGFQSHFATRKNDLLNDDDYNLLPSLVNTPMASSHHRTTSLDTSAIKTPASTTDFIFDRIQNSSSRTSTVNSSTTNNSDAESNDRKPVSLVKGLGIDNAGFGQQTGPNQQFYYI